VSHADYASYGARMQENSFTSLFPIAQKPSIGIPLQQQQNLAENGQPAASEVQGMIDFLRGRHKGASPIRQPSLLVHHEVSLPLSAETLGWLQQNDTDDDALSEGSALSRPMRGLEIQPPSTSTSAVSSTHSSGTTFSHRRVDSVIEDQFIVGRYIATGLTSPEEAAAEAIRRSREPSFTWHEHGQVQIASEYMDELAAAESFGESIDGHQTAIPFREQDDPPDPLLDSCPAKR